MAKELHQDAKECVKAPLNFAREAIVMAELNIDGLLAFTFSWYHNRLGMCDRGKHGAHFRRHASIRKTSVTVYNGEVP